MTKKDLIKGIADKSGITTKQAVAALDAALEGIIAAVCADDKVQITGFGTFEDNVRATRTGRNSATSETIEIPETERIDYEAALRIAEENRPKLIIAGASAYPRFIDWAKMREIADSVGAYLMVDMAHIAGLVAAGLHPSPVPYADVVTSTTHKTLRGPRGALILCRQDLAKKIDSAVFPGTQGGPLMHVIAAKAVAFGEALTPEFRTYQQQILNNVRTLAETLQTRGIRLVSGGTDVQTHSIH